MSGNHPSVMSHRAPTPLEFSAFTPGADGVDIILKPVSINRLQCQ